MPSEHGYEHVNGDSVAEHGRKCTQFSGNDKLRRTWEHRLFRPVLHKFFGRSDRNSSQRACILEVVGRLLGHSNYLYRVDELEFC